MRIAVASISANDDLELRDAAERACQLWEACRVPPFLLGASFRTRVIAAAALLRNNDFRTAAERAFTLELICRQEIQAARELTFNRELRMEFDRLRRSPKKFFHGAILLLTQQKRRDRAKDYFIRFLNSGHRFPLLPASRGKFLQMTEGDPAFTPALALLKGLEFHTIPFYKFAIAHKKFAEFWQLQQKKRSKRKKMVKKLGAEKSDSES